MATVRKMRMVGAVSRIKETGGKKEKAFSWSFGVGIIQKSY